MTIAKDEKPKFEDALARLEKIVAEMEAGELPLDKAMAHFEEGMTLVASCSKKLSEVEKKIEVLVKKGEALHTEPFEPS